MLSISSRFAASIALGLSTCACIPVASYRAPSTTVSVRFRPPDAEGLLLLVQEKKGGYVTWGGERGPKTSHRVIWLKRLQETKFTPPKEGGAGLALLVLMGSLETFSSPARLLVLGRGYTAQWVDLDQAYTSDTPISILVTLTPGASSEASLRDDWRWLSDLNMGKRARAAVHRFLCQQYFEVSETPAPVGCEHRACGNPTNRELTCVP